VLAKYYVPLEDSEKHKLGFRGGELASVSSALHLVAPSGSCGRTGEASCDITLRTNPHGHSRALLSTLMLGLVVNRSIGWW